MVRSACVWLVIGVFIIPGVSSSRALAQAPRPNVVIMYADNLGFGEVGIYGGVRGVPTPRLDALAREGLRLTNFNVETFCTPSRTALLTGRYGVRSGTLGYPLPVTGMTLWEVTLAELPEAARICHRALRQVARGQRRGPRADNPGFRRVVWHSRLEQRVAAQHVQRHAVHLGRAAPARPRVRSKSSTSRRGARWTARAPIERWTS